MLEVAEIEEVMKNVPVEGSVPIKLRIFNLGI